MIHKNDDGTFCISSYQVWIPGCYDSKRSANYAFRFDDKVLYALQQKANTKNNGIITYQDLKKEAEK